jgi:hypothetical protein
MKRPLEDILSDFPNVVERNLPVPEMQLAFIQKKKMRKKPPAIFYTVTAVAAVVIILMIPFFHMERTWADKIIYNGFNCPIDADIVDTSIKDKHSLEKVLDQIIRNVYTDPEYATYQVKSVELAPQSPGGYKGIIKENCSDKVFQNSWVVQLSFPKLEAISASLSQGQIFIAKTKDGWIVWKQYH